MTRTTRVTQRPNARMSTGGLRPRQQMPLSAQRPNARMSTGGLRPRKQMPLSAQRPNSLISTGGRVPRRRLLFDDEPNVDSALLSRAHREEAVSGRAVRYDTPGWQSRCGTSPDMSTLELEFMCDPILKLVAELSGPHTWHDNDE